MFPVFRLCVMFLWCVLFPADLAQAKCVLVYLSIGLFKLFISLIFKIL
jgi:hypothetical protein